MVALGASAGGLGALQQFFSALPERCQGMSFVVVQHLSPDHKSLMRELLERATPMTVVVAKDGQLLAPNTVLLMPAGCYLECGGGRLGVTLQAGRAHLPIDHFFSALAEDVGDRSVAMVFSGTGSDGSLGVLAIKEAGGLVMAQEESTAEYTGMPRAAIDTGSVDFVLSPSQMAAELANYLDHRGRLEPQEVESGPITHQFLDTLREKTQIDFSQYKKDTLMRRVRRRMAVRQVRTLSRYSQLLSSDAQEAKMLTRDILIGVTRFFRDPDAFRELDIQVITPLLESSLGRTIRIWVPGCSTGEEVYSLVILFQERALALGQQLDLKVFATDLDREALRAAGRGLYTESISADLSAERLSKHFVAREGGGYKVNASLRESVVFSHHNLVQDPPFTGLDLISCRNLLIYFEGPLKKKVLSFFHFALLPGGSLFLGASESPLELQASFAARDPNSRIYQKLGISPGLYRWPMSISPQLASTRHDPVKQLARALDQGYRILLEEHCPPAILVDQAGQVVHVFVNADRYLKFPSGSVLLGLTDLLTSKLAAIASAALFRAFREDPPADHLYPEILVKLPGPQGSLAFRARPLRNHQAVREFALVTFRNLADPPDGEFLVSVPELDVDSQDHILALSQELQQVRINFQVTVEELETANEELQATNEEFQATSQEYQTTADQLRQELKDANQEVLSLTNQYRLSQEKQQARLLAMGSFLDHSQPAILFLDEQLQILYATPGVHQYIPILAQDVGRPIEHFAPNFPSAHFLGEARQVLASGSTFEHSLGMQSSEEHFHLRMAPYAPPDSARGVAVTFSLPIKSSSGILAAIQQPALLVAGDGLILSRNQAWKDQEPAGSEPGYLPNQLRDWGAEMAANRVDLALAGLEELDSLDYRRESGGRINWTRLCMRRLTLGVDEYLITQCEIRDPVAP